MYGLKAVVDITRYIVSIKRLATKRTTGSARYVLSKEGVKFTESGPNDGW